MKILVCVNSLIIGGEGIQAIDLAMATRARGHDVLLAAPEPGPLAEWARKREISIAYLNAPRVYPFSFHAMQALRRVVRGSAPHLVHAYGLQATVEAFFGPFLLDGVPLVSSQLIPVSHRFHERLAGVIPLIAATQFAHRHAQKARRGPVYLLEPAVDVSLDHPLVDGSGFRDRLGPEDRMSNVVVVSRLDRLQVQDKVAGIERLIDAVAMIGHEMPVRLIIVGTGSAFGELSARAERINTDLGRPGVLMVGPMVDPGPAYAVADIVVGQASSVVRGMAHGKPAIVVGDFGFSEIVTPETVGQFLDFGWWGIGDGVATSERLCEQLRTLLHNGSMREELGRFGRELVCAKYSLETAGAALEEIYRSALGSRPTARALLPDVVRTAGWVAIYRALPKPRAPRDGDAPRPRRGAA